MHGNVVVSSHADHNGVHVSHYYSLIPNDKRRPQLYFDSEHAKSRAVQLFAGTNAPSSLRLSARAASLSLSLLPQHTIQRNGRQPSSTNELFIAKLRVNSMLSFHDTRRTSKQRTQATPASNGALSVELSQSQLHVEQRYASNDQHQNVRYQKRTFQSHKTVRTLKNPCILYMLYSSNMWFISPLRAVKRKKKVSQ